MSAHAWRSPLRAADLRFLLPTPPRSVALLGSTIAHAPAWRSSGVDVVTRPHDEVDLVVTDRPWRVANETARARVAVVLLGWPAVTSGPPDGWTVRRYAVEGLRRKPRWFLLTDTRVRGYFGRTWSRPRRLHGRLRNSVFAGPLGPATASMTVLTPGSAPPYPLRSAAQAGGLPPATAWALQLGDGDDLQRAVAHAFPAASATPAWVLKFSRVPGAPPRGEQEERVLAALARRSARSAAHVAPVLRSLQLDGSLATVERAALGSTLAARLLTSSRTTRARAIADVIEWTAGMAADTTDHAAGPTAVASVVEQTLQRHGCVSLATRFAGAPAVLAHNDLGTWNVLDDGRSFTVVDWESADPAGLPLWDLAYFATDALSLIHGPRREPDRIDWCRKLWRGEVPASAQLSRWLSRAARAFELTDDAAAALVTASWLHHGLSRERRSRWLGDLPVREGYLGRLGREWLADPALGVAWDGFRELSRAGS